MTPRIEIVRGDITREHVDAIVNAANSSLLGGGGVDGAIHRAAGPRLLEACRELRATSLPGGLPPGDAVATPGFDLPARWVIHTVGPNRNAGQKDPAVLTSCFHRSLEVAGEIGAATVAFPAIGAGVYGWSPEACAASAHSAFIDEGGGWPSISLVRVVAFSEAIERAFLRAFA